ncbi:MAG: hypothetical protein LUG66_01465, partial [Clostridiales bacterium]|nr:hypothetical protein [Clostridiales bacterium]
MITYEVLKDLESSCLDLILSSTYLDGLKEEDLDKLTKAYRKIVIASEMLDRNIICISGNQGAGKTTLVKNYYGLSDDYFNISLGRGEKLPVLITEKVGCKAPKMTAVYLKKEGSDYKKIVETIDNTEKFRQISSGEDGISQDTHTMYLELTIPPKYFSGENFSIMLLPGFERKRDYWQTLIELSVNCCDSAIFVFDEANLARNDNKRLLDNVKTKFGKNAIYAISHSDTSQDGNAAVKKTCMEVMGIDQYESDRVVCIGAYTDPEKNKEWIKNLNNAIEKYCNTSSEALNNNRKYIGKIIFSELKPLIRTFDGLLKGQKTDELIVKLQDNEFLKAFDDIKKSRRDEIEEKLKRELETAKGKTIANLENNMLTKDTESLVKKIPRAIFGSNKIKLIQEARQRVFEALQDGNGVFYHQQAFVDAIEATQASLKDSNKAKEFLLEDNSSGFFADEDEENSESENQLAVKQETLKTNAAKLANDVKFFMAPNSGMD